MTKLYSLAHSSIACHSVHSQENVIYYRISMKVWFFFMIHANLRLTFRWFCVKEDHIWSSPKPGRHSRWSCLGYCSSRWKHLPLTCSIKYVLCLHSVCDSSKMLLEPTLEPLAYPLVFEPNMPLPERLLQNCFIRTSRAAHVQYRLDMWPLDLLPFTVSVARHRISAIHLELFCNKLAKLPPPGFPVISYLWNYG